MIKIGADPELFLKNDQEIISAIGLIGGTKNNPKSISNDGHSVQEDNVMVEFNIPPSKNEIEFLDNMEYCMEYIEKLAILNDLQISNLASAELNPKYLQSAKSNHFGCEPDYNVYKQSINNFCNEGIENLRSCAGHIHIGYDDPNQEETERIVKLMDLFLGLPSILLDKDSRRKELYGKAGCFRFKPYGLEYRTLSNFWIFSKDLQKWAYNQTIKAVQSVTNFELNEFIIANEKQIEKAINNNDKKLVKEIINNLNKINICVDYLVG